MFQERAEKTPRETDVKISTASGALGVVWKEVMKVCQNLIFVSDLAKGALII